MRPEVAPDNTAVRVALWRALHLEADAPPHVFVDTIGLKIAAPEEGWRSRADMSPFTRPFRASIVARARFIEDLVVDQVARGVDQYVILGAGFGHVRPTPTRPRSSPNRIRDRPARTAGMETTASRRPWTRRPVVFAPGPCRLRGG